MARGIVFWLLYQVCLVTEISIIHGLGDKVSLSQLTFLRGLGCLLLLLICSRKRLFRVFKTEHSVLHLTRGLLTIIALWLIYYGIQRLSLSDSTMITYLRPIFVFILGVVVLSESATTRKSLTVFLSLSGTILAVCPGLNSIEPDHLVSVLIAALGSFLGAAATIATRHLSSKSTTETMLAYMCVVMIAASPLAFVHSWPWSEWIDLVSISIIGGLSVWTSIVALRHADASLLGPLEYIRIPITLIFAFSWFSEIPSPWTLAGSALILASSVTLLMSQPDRIILRPTRD